MGILLLCSQIGGLAFFAILLHKALHRFYVAAWDRNSEKLIRKGGAVAPKKYHAKNVDY